MAENATPHTLFRRWIEEVWNGSPEAARRLVTEDFVGHWPDREVRGPDALVAAIAETHDLATEARFELTLGPFAEGDLVAGRWAGTLRTPGGELRFTGNDILRVRDGRFAEYWNAAAQLD
ncbi:nuclear transport factor 2 family protein [Streptomyces sp. DSM 44915]|uniref:Nuclear transport factor 2 family protein n=1 Tax=Streptomyces chisholmiae TaxID=3075540 RepID=A0ABU2JXB2_9ACTN|nr:nuclear transport factor 2 family protein [Streptomyces sp. DSM 44915]MDT0269640.1 nuclear transport factor 2 family protein [Streptomyces sp. DSM 44915]